MKKFYFAFLFGLILGPSLVFGATTLDSYASSNYDTLKTNQLCGTERQGQSFTANGGKITDVNFYLQNGTDTGTMVAEIYQITGSSGAEVPVGGAIGTSDSVDISTFSTLADVTFHFSSPVTVSNGTKYAVVINPSGVTCNGSGPRMGQDTSSPSHAGNYFRSLNSGASYTPQAGQDAIFAVLDNTEAVVTGFSLSPSSGPADTVVHATCSAGPNSAIAIFDPSGNFFIDFFPSGGSTACDQYNATYQDQAISYILDTTPGAWKGVIMEVSGDCDNSCSNYTATYDEAKASAYFSKDLGTVFTITGSPTPTLAGLASLFSVATTTFRDTTGIEYTDVTSWSGSMIKLVIGSGLGFLSGIMPWIIAILVFIATLALIFRGFRFMRH